MACDAPNQSSAAMAITASYHYVSICCVRKLLHLGMKRNQAIKFVFELTFPAGITIQQVLHLQNRTARAGNELRGVGIEQPNHVKGAVVYRQLY